jgi:tRNA threonylcarbamoyladenosine biosynthesis protein TsaB
MNKVVIDTSLANKIKVILNVGKEVFTKESEQKFGSQALLGSITELIEQAGIEFKDLTTIEVATGPGSYTGLRVGVSVANALSYSLGIPVNGKTIETEVVY